jgi:hypothetical protein
MSDSVIRRRHAAESALGAAESAVRAADDRPDFMQLLGLLPPYTTEDVHKAYRARAQEAHPDRGGSNEQFARLQEAYEQAQQYVGFVGARRDWMAAQVEPYLRQQEIVSEIERRGARAQVTSVDWMQRSFGDFATLCDRLTGVAIGDSGDADGLLRFLAANARNLRHMNDLDLRGSRLTDEGLLRARTLRGLVRLNLAQTAVSLSGLALLESLPELRWLNVGGTSIGWWSRWRLARAYPHLTITPRPGERPA